jgi:hypothetical protein
MQTDLIQSDSPRWRECLGDVAHDVYHLPEYVQLEAAREGGQALAFFAEDKDGWLLAPLVTRRIDRHLPALGPLYDATGPYGFASPLVFHRSSVPDHRDAFTLRAFEEMQRELGERNIVSAFLRLHPLLPTPSAQLSKIGCVVDHGQAVYVDLQLSDEQLWNQTRPRYRSYINKARRTGYVASFDDTWSSLETFVDLYHQTMCRVNAADRYFFSFNYFTELREKLSGRLFLCKVEIDGLIVCAGLFSECDGIVQYLYGGGDSAHLACHGTKLMIDHVRSWAKQRGNRLLHLGGGVGGQNDSLFQFKSGFSRSTCRFTTLRFLTNPVAYRALVRDWEDATQAAADGMREFFPAYRKPAGDASNSLDVRRAA